MGIVDKFKNLVNPIDNDDDFEGEGYDFSGDDDDGAADGGGFDDGEKYADDDTQEAPQPQSGGKRSEGGQPNNLDLTGNLSLKMMSPTKWENVSTIADHLINGCTVIINLESTGKELMMKMLNFLSGVIYTIGGNMKNVSPKSNTWVLVPKAVELTQEQQQQQRPPQRKKPQAQQPFDPDPFDPDM